ncbi:hypothetical protein [Frankia tisae]|uniref:hypothetical protein n=1 Tax=Frankia tisae TaxID=2950104 RepID=UPI0021BED78B|nr:hypothetical protein [Frankia tisae]
MGAGDYPAILGLQGDRNLSLSDYPYLTSWATALAFEIRAAATAQASHTHRWILAVPQVWYDDGEIIQARPLYTMPLQPSETETISWMSYDATDGVDYGRLPFACRPDGQPVFDDLDYFTSPVQPLLRHPGGALRRPPGRRHRPRRDHPVPAYTPLTASNSDRALWGTLRRLVGHRADRRDDSRTDLDV